MVIVSSVLFCLSDRLTLYVLFPFLYKSVYVRNVINKYAFNIDLALSHYYFCIIKIDFNTVLCNTTYFSDSICSGTIHNEFL